VTVVSSGGGVAVTCAVLSNTLLIAERSFWRKWFDIDVR
jgi:hypothetical protein